MSSTIVRRLLAVVPTIVVATVVVFGLVQITPGGAAEAAAGPTATPQQVHALALQMGLDKPLPVQYATWLWNLAHGDFGQSLINRQSISQEIGQRLPVTLELTLGALLGVAILIERIFVIPGMGSMLVDGVTQKDFPVMQGVTAVFVGIVIFINLAVDLSYAVLDPRIRR